MMTNPKTMAPYRCPKCGSDAIRDGKTGHAGVNLYEFVCMGCGLFDTRRADAPDFDAWWQTWSPPSPPSPLAAILAAPGDDAPRLTYADAIAASDPARAELIRLQLARATEERKRISHVDLATPGERALLREHGARWAADLIPMVRPVMQPKPDPGYAFIGGFVGYVRIAPAALSDRLFELAPVQHVDVIGVQSLPPLLGSPQLRRLCSLGLIGQGLDDAAAAAIAASPQLAGLRWLDLRDNQIGEPGVRALAASPAIRAIPVVLLAGNPYNPARQYSYDIDGSAADSWRPELADELEQAHGPIGWLELSPAHELPDRLLAR